MEVFIAAVSLALIVSFLCSIFESVLLSLNSAQVEVLAEQGSPAGKLMRRFKERIDTPIAAILILNTIAHTIGAAVAGASYENVFDPATLWIFSLIFTAAVLLITEIIPKTLGVAYAQRLAAPVAYGIQALILILRPLVAVTEKLSSALRGNARPDITSIEEIRLLARLGRSQGAVGAKTAGIIVGATQLRKLRAIDVMIPRQDVVFISGLDSPGKTLERIRQTRHSRYPFTPSLETDQFSGVVLAKDLLLHLESADGDQVEWPDLIIEPLVVPETQPLNMLLRSFQDAHRHMAFVVDEYGDIQGIVTIEDVLEEIVGDIVDESDIASDDIARLADGSLEVRADMDLRRLATVLGVKWDRNEPAITINGLVSGRLGRLPIVGDAIVWQQHRIEVLTANERRAETVAVRDHDSGPG